MGMERSEDEVQFPAKIFCRALLQQRYTVEVPFWKKKIRKQPVIPFYYNMELLFLSFFVSLLLAWKEKLVVEL